MRGYFHPDYAVAQGAPNHYAVQLASGAGLDGLGYASFILNGNTQQVQSNASYFGNDQNGGAYGANTQIMVHDIQKGILYFYHPNYNYSSAQQGSITSLGLSPDATKKLRDHILRTAARQGIAANLVPDIAGWVIVVIGALLLAAAVVIAPAALAALIALAAGAGAAGAAVVFASVLTASLGSSFLLFVAGTAFFAALTYAFFYPTTTNTPGGGWQNCNILGCTACNLDQNSGTVNCTPSTGGPGDWLVSLAIGIGAVALVVVGGVAAYRIVRGQGIPRPYFAPRPYYAPPPPPPPPPAAAARPT